MAGTSNRPTVDDVGRAAGVSRATVTFVLSRGKYFNRITDETKRKVFAAARRLGYRRNSIGVALQRGYSDTVVLLVVSQDLVTAHLDTISSVNRAVAGEGLATIVQLATDDDEAIAFIDRIRSLNPYGLVVLWDSHAVPVDDLLDLRSEQLPIVDLLPSDVEGIASVTADREQGFYLCTQHLIGLGHRSIGMITEAAIGSKTARLKLAGYRRAMEEANIDCDEDLIEQGPGSDFQAGYEALPKLLERRPEVTAVMTVGDVLAVGAAAAAAQMGIVIPDHLSITGWGGRRERTHWRPQITSIAAPYARLAQDAVTMLMRMRSDPAWRPQSLFLPVELIMGESTGPVRSRRIL